MAGAEAWGDVVSLHRYPVKSLLGEDLAELLLEDRGVVDDRRWSVRTDQDKIGSGKNTRRFTALEGLLRLRASHDGGRVVVSLPDGTCAEVGSPEAADLVSSVVGVPLGLAEETSVSHFDDGPVSLIGTASIAAVAERFGTDVPAARFRPNILVHTRVPFAEDHWVGRTVRLGSARLVIEMTSPRCVMLDAATADLPAASGLLRAVGAVNGARLGVIGRVITPGRAVLGDVVVPDRASTPPLDG